jgi:hypothetical protein
MNGTSTGKWIRVALLGAAQTLAATDDPRAATYAGVRGGVAFEAEDPFLGMELLVSMSDGWWFNPNVEHVFRDGTDVTSFNADVHRDLETASSAFVWLGAGPAILVREDAGFRNDDDTDLALNGLMGVGWRTGGGTVPYVQAKVVMSDDVDGSLGVGIRF